MRCSRVRRIGQFFRIMTDNWSSGQADELDLDLFIALATAWYVGGLARFENTAQNFQKTMVNESHPVRNQSAFSSIQVTFFPVSSGLGLG